MPLTLTLNLCSRHNEKLRSANISGEIGPEFLKPADAVLQIENASRVGGHKPTDFVASFSSFSASVLITKIVIRETVTYLSDEEKQLVRNCDWVLIPVMVELLLHQSIPEGHAA
jgi:hypothetical protein